MFDYFILVFKPQTLPHRNTVVTEKKKKKVFLSKQPRIGKAIMKKKKIVILTYPDFQTYYQATVIKIVWHWHKSRHTEQWHRIKNPEINLFIYGKFVFDKSAKKTQWGANKFLASLF